MGSAVKQRGLVASAIVATLLTFSGGVVLATAAPGDAVDGAEAAAFGYQSGGGHVAPGYDQLPVSDGEAQGPSVQGEEPVGEQGSGNQPQSGANAEETTEPTAPAAPTSTPPASGVVAATIEVTEDANWDGLTLVRDAAFTEGPMVVVRGSAKLTLTNTTIDGGGVDVTMPEVSAGPAFAAGSAMSIVDDAS